MSKFFKSDFLRETLTYLAVGVTATLVSLALQFVFTAVFMLGYFLSSTLSFALSSPISFFLNRRFTFRAGELPLARTLARFYMIVIPCFLLSYLFMRPALEWVFGLVALPWPEQYQTYAQQLVANGIFIVINYLGQKFFAFKADAERRTTDDGQA